MSIRKRMVMLSVGIVVPLALVGLAMLWGLWRENREQLDASVEKQAELAAVAFERWVDGQRQPLTVIAAQAAKRPAQTFAENLPFVIEARPYWLDLRILDAAHNTVVSQPADAQALRPDFVNTITSETRRRNSWAVVTDWTRGEGQPIIAVAAPIEGGGSVVARIDGAAMGDIFRDIRMSDGAVIVVFDSQRRVLYRSAVPREYLGTDRSGSPMFVPLSEQRKAVVEAVSPYDGVPRVYGLVRVGSTDCVVAIGVPTSTLYRPARRQLILYLAFSLVALLSALAAALLIARRIVRPVQRLGAAARQFGGGDLGVRAPVGGGGELEELAAVFNDMAEEIEKRTQRLAELDRLKSEFVGGVSHELRTPLATIKTLTRLLQRGVGSEEERREYLETIAAECDRQIDLVLNLLDLTRIESGAYKVSVSRVDAAEAARAAVRTGRHAAEARGHTLALELSEGLPPVAADAAALRRVLCGLVENAIKYTPDGGHIRLSARTQDGEVTLSVADDGCGILPEDVPHVFEKFFRGRPADAPGNVVADGEPQSCSAVPGVGLGLYLAQTIAGQFGGRVSVESVAGRGSVFTVHLPLWRGAADDGADDSTDESEEGRHVEAAARG